ncbi:MAG: hypothetical protein M3Y35_01415, partial [Actinomycetota bacterium]|nr:hypothetical protein [Actinomycetota bacterium]
DRVLDAGFDWTQDAIEVEPGVMLIADANHNRLVRWTPPDRYEDTIVYPKDWKVFQIELLDHATAGWLANTTPTVSIA